MLPLALSRAFDADLGNPSEDPLASLMTVIMDHRLFNRHMHMHLNRIMTHWWIKLSMHTSRFG